MAAAALVLLVALPALLLPFHDTRSGLRTGAPALSDAVQAGPYAGGELLSLGMSTDPSDSLGVTTAPGTALAPAARAAGLSILRFGDIDADNYDWRSGCIYGDDGRLHPQCADVPGTGSLDRFLRLAGAIGATPFLVVNGQIDDPQQAAAEVAYYQDHCAALLRVHTCPEPYWEIGSSPATWRHYAIPMPARRPDDGSMIQPDQYAALVSAYAAAMGQVDHQIQIVANDWIAGATDQSWVASVAAVDTHYAPLLSSGTGSLPTAAQVIASVKEGSPGRLGVDDWIQDLRGNLSQFSNSRGVDIVMGSWSIDANVNPGVHDNDPTYQGYAQALFTAVLFAHLWQDADPLGANPLIMALQFPIIGTSQEPFDVVTGGPHPAVAVYALLHGRFGAHPSSVQIGGALQRAGVVAAASYLRPGLLSVLLINTGARRAVVHVRGAPSGTQHAWCIGPDPHAPTAVTEIRAVAVANGRIGVTSHAICVVQAGRQAK